MEVPCMASVRLSAADRSLPLAVPSFRVRMTPVAQRALTAIGYTIGGFLVLAVIWLLAATAAGKDLPTPMATLGVAWQLISNPFYDKGPNDKGIALQLFSSLGRVFLGFFLASLLAIPVGFLMGANEASKRIDRKSVV